MNPASDWKADPASDWKAGWGVGGGVRRRGGFGRRRRHFLAGNPISSINCVDIDGKPLRQYRSTGIEVFLHSQQKHVTLKAAPLQFSSQVGYSTKLDPFGPDVHINTRQYPGTTTVARC